MAYIQIDRKLFNHFLWTENRVWSKFEAWIDLIQLVSYTENNDRIINGVLVTWNRGEFPVSYSFLSQRWNWSAQRTRGYIQLLKSNNQINTRTTSVATILTLCNYEQYNPKQQADKSKITSVTTSGQQADNKRTAGIKESNTSKEEKKYIDDPDLNLLFIDFLNMRKEIKKPATNRAIELLIIKLNNLSQDKEIQKAIIEQSIIKNYQGLFMVSDFKKANLKTEIPITDPRRISDINEWRVTNE